MTRLRAAAVPVGLAAAAAILFAVASIHRHDRFGSYGYDLGVFDQSVWQYSHLELGPNTVKRAPYLLGDHFDPILFTLAPLYRLWDDVKVLLLVQAVLLAASSLPLYAWARARLGVPAAACVQLAYLVFWGLTAGALFDFHDLAFAVPAVSLALYGALTRRNGALLAGLALGLASKEDVALTLAALGLYMALVQGRRRLGLGITAASAAWFFLAVWVVQPALADGGYAYWRYDVTVVHASQKLSTVAALLAAWLALPVLSPVLLVAAPTLAERVFSTTPSHWSTGFHYSLVIAPILGFATVDSLARIRARHPAATLPLAAAAALAGVVTTFAALRPLEPLTQLVSSRRADEIRACLATISPGASVSASNALIPHLTHRHEIYPLFIRRRTEYIALDTSTSLAGLTPAGARTIVRRSLRNGYRLRCRRGATIVVERYLSRP